MYALIDVSLIKTLNFEMLMQDRPTFGDSSFE